MDNLVGFPSHSNDDDVDEIFINIIPLLGKRLDPDFYVQSVNKIYTCKSEGFDLSGFDESQLCVSLWYFFSAVTGDGIPKAGWIMHPLLRNLDLRPYMISLVRQIIEDCVHFLWSVYIQDNYEKYYMIKSPGLLNQHLTSDFRNHVAENTLSEVKLQLLSSHISASALEIMLQKIYGLNVSKYQVHISLLMPEIMSQKIRFRARRRATIKL